MEFGNVAEDSGLAGNHLGNSQTAGIEYLVFKFAWVCD